MVGVHAWSRYMLRHAEGRADGRETHGPILPAHHAAIEAVVDVKSQKTAARLTNLEVRRASRMAKYTVTCGSLISRIPCRYPPKFRQIPARGVRVQRR